MTETRSGTETFAFADIREVWRMAGQEITTICRLAGSVAITFNVDQAIVDCNMLAMNDVIDKVALEIVLGEKLVRRYEYRIVTGEVNAHGPSPDNPPMGAIPAGARVRLIATHNTKVPKQERDDWFARLKWQTAKPAEVPAGATARVYGAFVSSTYGLERSVLVNPEYDQPLNDRANDVFNHGGGSK